MKITAKSRAEGQMWHWDSRVVPTAFLWHNTGKFAALQETFCDVCGPQSNLSNDVDMFRMFSDLNLMQHIHETNKYAQQQTVVSPHLFFA
jgi:hypothetical protein